MTFNISPTHQAILDSDKYRKITSAAVGTKLQKKDCPGGSMLQPQAKALKMLPHSKATADRSFSFSSVFTSFLALRKLNMQSKLNHHGKVSKWN
jgi:hypothetical protein